MPKRMEIKFTFRCRIIVLEFKERPQKDFTIFQTTNSKTKSGSSGTTGISLATVKSLVEGLGGSIWIL
ncbi:MAG: hypothetical protein DA405_08860 [Bacteroidetes bacterium]|nr:MAG: hypothetical protein DA405_08860 [Bacteroidota bacterium]